MGDDDITRYRDAPPHTDSFGKRRFACQNLLKPRLPNAFWGRGGTNLGLVSKFSQHPPPQAGTSGGRVKNGHPMEQYHEGAGLKVVLRAAGPAPQHTPHRYGEGQVRSKGTARDGGSQHKAKGFDLCGYG